LANHGSVHIFVERVCEDSSRSSCWPLQRAPPFPRWLTLGPGRNAGASGSTVITCGAAVHCPHRDTIIIARRRVIGRRLTGIRGGQRASPRIVVSDTALTAYRSNRSKPQSAPLNQSTSTTSPRVRRVIGKIRAAGHSLSVRSIDHSPSISRTCIDILCIYIRARPMSESCDRITQRRVAKTSASVIF